VPVADADDVDDADAGNAGVDDVGADAENADDVVVRGEVVMCDAGDADAVEEVGDADCFGKENSHCGGGDCGCDA